jgi:hypothetical protein
MTTTTARPKAILLARLSDSRDDVDLTDEGIPSGLDDQIRRMREKAAHLGWDVWKVIKNPASVGVQAPQGRPAGRASGVPGVAAGPAGGVGGSVRRASVGVVVSWIWTGRFVTRRICKI